MAEFGSSSLLRFLQQESRRLQEENDQLREEVTALRGYMDALRDLHRVARTINVEDEVMPVLSQILYAALTVTDSSAGSLLLRDPETDELVFVLVHGGRQDVLQGYRLAKGAGVVGWAATHKEPVIVNQPRQDWRFSSQVDETFSFETQNLMALPLIARGRVLGVLEVLNKFSGKGYTDSDLDLLSLLGLVSAEVLAVMETQSVEG